VLNLSAFAIGCCISPKRMLHAFVRGRRSKNLYGEGFDAARLTQKVGDVRRELGLDQAVPSATAAELLAFVGWVLLGALYAFGGMLSLAAFAFSLWKMPREGKALPAPHAQAGTTAPAQ
jgi:hypothetical protein